MLDVLTLQDFETDQPFATRFLTEALQSDHLVNAYIVRGADLHTAYALVLRLAQIINCAASLQPQLACGECQSCKWIGQNAHPGVITLSNATYRNEKAEWDKETGLAKPKASKMQQSIVVAQLEQLLGELSLSSGGFHRVVILTGAEEVAPIDSPQPLLTPPQDWTPQTAGHVLTLKPLDRAMFPERLANKFLKTLEEPPKDTLFFLLTDGDGKLMETIVSRCQVLPLRTPAQHYQVTVPAEAQAVFEPLLQSTNTPLRWQQLQPLLYYCVEHDVEMDTMLAQLQAYVWQQPVKSFSSQPIVSWRRAWVSQIDHTRRLLRDNVRPEAALEAMLLSAALGE